MNLLENLQKSDSKVRNKSFDVILKLIQNPSDSDYYNTIQMLKQELPSLCNEKNLKIQSIILKIINHLIENNLFSINEGHKMLIFNLLDKFLSSTNKNVKAQTKKIITKCLTLDPDNMFTALFSLFPKLNPKLCKGILFLFDENDIILNHSKFEEDEISSFISKFYQNRMADIKKGILKLLKALGNIFGSSFIENISSLSEKDKSKFINYSEDLLKGAGVKNTQSKSTKNTEKVPENQKKISEKKIDSYITAVPQNITTKFNKAFVAKILSLAKWKNKITYLDQIKKDCETIVRLNPNDDYSHLLELISVLITDKVLLIKVSAVNLLGVLFRGLRKEMKRTFKSYFKLLLNMMKDKKPMMTNALQLALQPGFYILPLGELYEEIKLYNKERNKDIRIQIIQLISKYSEFSFLSKKTKLFAKTFIELMSVYAKDPDSEVKNKLMIFLKNYIKQCRKELDPTQTIQIQELISTNVKGSQKIIASLGEYTVTKISNSETNDIENNCQQNSITSAHFIDEKKPQKKKSLQSRVPNKRKISRTEHNDLHIEELSFIDYLQNFRNNPNEENLSKLQQNLVKENITIQIVQCSTDLLQQVYEIIADILSSDNKNIQKLALNTIIQLNSIVSKTSKKYIISSSIFLESVWQLVLSDNNDIRFSALNFLENQASISKNSSMFYDCIIKVLNQLVQSKNSEISQYIFDMLNGTKWIHHGNQESKLFIFFNYQKKKPY